MEFTYTVMFRGKIVGTKTCIAPTLEAFEFFIQDKIARHMRLGRHNDGTGFTFLTEGLTVSAA